MLLAIANAPGEPHDHRTILITDVKYEVFPVSESVNVLLAMILHEVQGGLGEHERVAALSQRLLLGAPLDEQAVVGAALGRRGVRVGQRHLQARQPAHVLLAEHDGAVEVTLLHFGQVRGADASLEARGALGPR